MTELFTLALEHTGLLHKNA